ncbi:MAG: hypothetical protein JJU02_12875 [Cryomorphaceae bacterium]|nr:hypothetical protein [Cryomorphaceae bacterium]
MHISESFCEDNELKWLLQYFRQKIFLMAKKYFQILLLLLAPLAIKAQVPEGLYIQPSFRGQYHTVLDRAQSPVHYSGLSGGMGLGFCMSKKNWIIETDVAFAYGILQPGFSKNPLGTELLLWQGQSDNRFLWAFYQKENRRILAGVNLPVFAQYREHNNFSNSSQTWNAYAAIGPEVAGQYTFSKFKRGWILDGFISVPVWGYATKPSFAQFSGLFWDNVGSRSWRESFWIQSEFRMRMMLMNGNQVGLSYRWNFYSDSRANLSQLAGQGLGLFLMFKL